MDLNCNRETETKFETAVESKLNLDRKKSNGSIPSLAATKVKIDFVDLDTYICNFSVTAM